MYGRDLIIPGKTLYIYANHKDYTFVEIKNASVAFYKSSNISDRLVSENKTDKVIDMKLFFDLFFTADMVELS